MEWIDWGQVFTLHNLGWMLFVVATIIASAVASRFAELMEEIKDVPEKLAEYTAPDSDAGKQLSADEKKSLYQEGIDVVQEVLELVFRGPMGMVAKGVIWGLRKLQFWK